jgi:type I restriction enzyme, S subunit
MNHWKTAMLGDLVERADTWNPAKAASEEVFNYIDLSAVDQEAKLIRGAQRVVGSEAPNRARQLVAKGDVLVSTVRPNLNGVAKVPEELDGATASTGFCILRARSTVLDRSYLFHWVKSPEFVGEMVRKATGASYPAVSDRIIFESQLPIPPVSEQRRIAEVLDRAEALRAKRRAALANLDTVTESIFFNLFGDPTTNPKGMTVVKLSDVATRITDGVHQKPNYTESGLPFISVKDITTGVLSFEDCKFVSQDDHNKFTKRCKPEKNDILYTKVGATYGRPALVDTDRDFSIYVSVCLIKPKKELVDPTFLLSALGTSAIKRQADNRIKGIGVPDLHLDQIQSFLIPLPSLSEQRDFSRRIAALEKVKAAHRASLTQLDALFAVLQHRAFRGEL